MNIILSIDEQILARAQQLAERRGMSLDELIRECLENLTASDTAQALAELERLWSEVDAGSGGWKWSREELYDRPVLHRAGCILELASAGLWEGDLSEMRDDRPVRKEPHDPLTEHQAIREVFEDERRQRAIRAVALRNAGRRADEVP
ncbi:MAG TPA: hypothetical protein VF179_03340 [Thermoanaerobaculia bacterium]|nr:hypothetical protein [Thermoanaerobaculia bacterium]